MSKKNKNKKPVLPNPCGFTEEEMHQIYKAKAHPLFWKQKAEELKYSAELLLPSAKKYMEELNELVKEENLDLSGLPPSVFSTVDGLMGFSLECLLKGCIIKDNPHFMDNGEQNNEMHTHDLVKLAEKAKINLNSDEIYVCQNLTKVMYVDFRYPVDKYATIRQGSSKVINFDEVFNGLYNRIHSMLN
jgi:hypothetical protein